MMYRAGFYTSLNSESCGDLLTMRDWCACVESGAFIDYDGFGMYATSDLETNIEIRPSMLKRNEIFKETYTHIMWYNR